MNRMDQPHGPEKPLEEKSTHGHETRDTNFRSVVVLLATLAVLTGIAFLLMLGLYRYFQTLPEKFPLPSPLAGSRQVYSGPKLQDHAQQDMKDWRAAEQAVLNSYGWVDPDKKIVRIPVSRAIDLMAERGLPVRIEEGGVKP